ncbi:hypothetical protein TD95_005380 [Thielaviopsis punctulata]|uniref:Uncharacterized protein n=1 Tax=Thielaviopsis punctulata TaxID=72032 RepID=A0A0F4Z8G5_9PEZI|nr:hypothetical protein TD95_005380 [Thielaviopsis punctulata]
MATPFSLSTSSSDISTPRSHSPSASPSVVSKHTSQFSVSTKRTSISSRRMTTDLNPMSSINVSAIEQAMKMASLDQFKGYNQNTFAEIKQETTTAYIPESEAAGYQILREPLWNKAWV